MKSEVEANDELASTYFDIWDNYPIQRFTNASEHAWLTSTIERRSKVLVAGSGGGRELTALIEKQCDIVAVDLSPRMLAAGQKRYGNSSIQWILSDIQSLPANFRNFDVVVALGAVLNYVPDLHSALRNFVSALRPKGTVLASLINSQHTTERQLTSAVAGLRYRKAYSSGELVSVFSECGFQQVSTIGFRYLVDYLPPEWNKNAATTPEYDSVLEKAIALEEQLLKINPPLEPKFLRLSAIKPA